MLSVQMLAKTLIDDHGKNRKSHSDKGKAVMGNAKSFDKHFLEIEPTAESLLSSVAALVRSIPSLGMTATVLSGRTALGVVLDLPQPLRRMSRGKIRPSRMVY